MTFFVSLFSQYFTCSRQSLVRRCVYILHSSVSGTARSHRSAPVPRLDSGGSRQRSGVRQGSVWRGASAGPWEDSRGDAEAAADFSADLPKAGKRDYHDPAVSPGRQRRQSTHRPHPGATGLNTDEQRKKITCSISKITNVFE